MEKKSKNSSVESSSIPPVVAVLGHVDHGKTSLLDAIRKTNIAAREHGGITQKIGASSVEITHEGKKRKITFIDTPGHHTFSKMRSRGATAADIGILVVSAVDGVMPQTRESLAALRLANIPFIVALTKADLPDKNVEKVKQQLLHEKVLLEGFGGDVPVIEVSAKTNMNVPELLDLILLVFDMMPKEKPKDDLLEAIVIESKLDPRTGPKATIVIKNGQISVRDDVVSEGAQARVRTLVNDRGEHVQKATVGEAVELLGFTVVPNVGSVVLPKDATKKPTIRVPQAADTAAYSPTLSEEKLSIILYADSAGSLEAIVAALPPAIVIVSQKTGEITAADVFLAKSTQAIIIGFNVRVPNDVSLLARTEKILLKNYTIIYELIDEVTEVSEGKAAGLLEQVYGTGKIQAVFPFEKTKVMGIVVTDGRVARGDKVRVERKETVVGEGTVTSVRQGKNQVSKVEKGQEAGIIITPLLDFTIGDVIVCHG